MRTDRSVYIENALALLFGVSGVVNDEKGLPNKVGIEIPVSDIRSITKLGAELLRALELGEGVAKTGSCEDDVPSHPALTL